MRSIRSAMLLVATNGTIGIEIATTSFTTPALIKRKKRIAITPAPAISIVMAPGRRFPTMAQCGFRKLTLAGRHIEPAAGFGSPIGDGRGLPMSPGAGRLITMAAGSSGAGPGPGGLVRSTPLSSDSGRRHTSPSLDLAEALASVLASAAVSDRLAGFPLGPAISFIRGGAVFATDFGVVGFDRIGGLRDGIAPLHAGGRFSNLREVP